MRCITVRRLMDKKFFSPLQLIQIATQHAYSAEHLYHFDRQSTDSEGGDTLEPCLSLMYLAFELTLKAYLLQIHNQNIQHKNLMELMELNSELDLSKQDQHLLKKLFRQQAFRKGIDCELGYNRQQLQVFCSEIMALYERLQELMPLELQKDYQP